MVEFDLGQGFTVPTTTVGRTSQPNQIEFDAEDETSSTNDYALDAPVPQSDIDNAPANYNPLGRATERVSDIIMLDREVRTSKEVFNAANYPVGNKENLLLLTSGTTTRANRLRKLSLRSTR